MSLYDRILDTSTGKEKFALRGQYWVKYTVSESAFTLAATAQDIELFQLPAKGVIHSVIIKHSTRFLGGTLTGFNISVGITGNLAKYASAFDVNQTVGASTGQSTSVMDFENMSAATSIRVAATSSGDNVNAATQGSVDIWVLQSVLP